MPIVPHFHREISNLPPFIMVVWCWRCFLRASVSLLCVCVCVCVCKCVSVCASVCVRAPIVWTNLFLKGEGILFAYLGERLSDKLKRGFKYDIGVCLFKKEVDTFLSELNVTFNRHVLLVQTKEVIYKRNGSSTSRWKWKPGWLTGHHLILLVKEACITSNLNALTKFSCGCSRSAQIKDILIWNILDMIM